MMLHSGLGAAASSFISMMLCKRYGYDMQTGIFLSSVLQSLFYKLESNEDKIFEILSPINIIIMVIMFGGYHYYGRLLEYFTYDQKSWSITLSMPNDIGQFRKYIDFFPEFFDSPQEKIIGDPKLYIEAKRFRHAHSAIECGNLTEFEHYIERSNYNEKINFCDKDFGVKGFYVWKYTTIDASDKEKTLQINHPHITITIFDKRITEYYKYIQQKVREKTQSNDFCQMYVRVIDGEGRAKSYTCSREKRQPIEELEKKYIKTLFHPDRDRLWKVIKTVHFNPSLYKDHGQTPRIGLCLYGPPGTGKSSFAYRIACALQRHICTVNLSLFKKSSDAFNMMRRPGGYFPEDVVVALDEFDLTIRELYNKSRQKDALMKFYMGRAASKFEIFESDNEDELVKKDNDDKKIKKKNKKKSLGYYGYDSEEFCLQDLLEIMQGPVPTDGQIIVATTNCFEEIQGYKPELFRDGRLTPVKFDNMDGNTLNEVSEHFFGKSLMLDIEPSDGLMPSFVLEKATEGKFNEHGWEWFVNEIKQKLDILSKRVMVEDVFA